MTPGEGTDYGAGGTNTLEFGSEASGHASFISRSKANGIKSCEAQPYELLADGTLWLDGWAYEVHELGDLVLLANDTDTLVLRRVDGAPPVTPCLQAEAVPFASPAVPLGGFSVLNGVGANLYFNTGAAGYPIVALDVVSKALGTARTYTGTSPVGGRGPQQRPLRARTRRGGQRGVLPGRPALTLPRTFSRRPA